jgi:hypothetical protein
MENITLKDATNKLTNRRAVDAEENRMFYDGDHLMKSKDYVGYIGILPKAGDADYSFVTEWLERIFAATNLVKSGVNRNLDGCLSREPDWNIIFPESVSETKAESLTNEIGGKSGSLVTWWNENQILQTVLREAGKTVLLEEEAYIRPIIPISLRDEKGQLKYKKSLSDALNLLDFEILTADKAGIFVDKETGQKFSLCRLETDKEKEVEISWIGDDGLTYLKILREDDLKAWAEKNFREIAAYIQSLPSNPETDAEPLDLGGRLYLQKITREMLITAPARSLQKSVNYALTTMNKNLNVAGGRDTYVTNAQRPKMKVETKDGDGNVISSTEEDAPLVKGASNANFIAGFPIYDDEGEKIVNYTQAGVTTIDPVAVDTFIKALEGYEIRFLREINQAHILSAELAQQSGVSRKEARSDFEKSLRASKTAFDPAGRYILEIALRLSAALSNRTADFAGTRFDFNCKMSAGAVDLEEVKQAALDEKEGRGSLYSYLSAKGEDDPDAEMSRIQSAPGYNLAQLAKAVEVSIASGGAIPLSAAVEMSAMTDEGKKAILAAIVEPKKEEGLPVEE